MLIDVAACQNIPLGQNGDLGPDFSGPTSFILTMACLSALETRAYVGCGGHQTFHAESFGLQQSTQLGHMARQKLFPCRPTDNQADRDCRSTLYL